MPRKEVVIGISICIGRADKRLHEGCHVGAYPLALLTDEGSPKVLFWGLDIRGVFFLGDFIFGQVKKSFVHGCTYTAIAWMRRSSELAEQGETKS